MISLIAGFTHNRVLGDHNTIPWHLPSDMRHFRMITEGNTVVMGRNTYDSLNKQALPNRRNIVVSRTLTSVGNGFELVESLEKALEVSDAANEDNEVFIIGGAKLYASALERDLIDSMYLTEIDAEVGGDVFFPEYNKSDWLEISRKVVPKDDKNMYDMTFVVLIRNRSGTTSIELI